MIRMKKTGVEVVEVVDVKVEHGRTLLRCRFADTKVASWVKHSALADDSNGNEIDEAIGEVEVGREDVAREEMDDWKFEERRLAAAGLSD